MSHDTGCHESAAIWRELYSAAILETDNAQLRLKVDAAQAAIDARLQELNGHVSDPERSELVDASHGLNILRSERQRPT